jgi:hypothetical protein
MRRLSIFFSAIAALALASCMDSGYDDVEKDSTGVTIDTTNIVSIQQLKETYRSTITGSGMKQITEDIQVKGWVTGNDNGSNLYNEISLQDNSGAIIVAINKGGLAGLLPVGQQVVFSLKGLYIGGYGSQAEIGGVYSNAKTGATSIGGMDRFTFAKHYMTIGLPNTAAVAALMTEFDYSKATDADYIFANQGKLMQLSDVTFKNGDGKSVFAPNDGSVTLSNNSANRGFVGLSDSKVVFRTSTYADFANDTIPQGKTKVQGIFTVYRSTWQILARTRSDAYGQSAY